MTEQEWLACEDALLVLRRLGNQLSDRKLRLWLCGGCRRVWPSLSLQQVRNAVEAAEQFSDGRIDDKKLATALEAALIAFAQFGRRNFHKLTSDPAVAIKSFKLTLAANAATPDPRQLLLAAEFPIPDDSTFRAVASPDLLRCVAGKPFRPVVFELKWRTDDVLGLARGIDEDRAFDRLPLLADAMMDAGCNDEQILAHCRQQGPHVRGCWVVDGCLGKL
jgi:hypothetical protein